MLRARHRIVTADGAQGTEAAAAMTVYLIVGVWNIATAMWLTYLSFMFCWHPDYDVLPL